jgi:8-oxo-dGTP pyrophosphatase MutT (NUDIX family)
MDSSKKNNWKTLSIKEVYENPWIKLDEHQVINPSGRNGIYGKVHFKNKAIGIIPLDENNNTWIVGQHRYTLDQWSWEIPEGGGPLDIDTLASAQRELKEETGLVATHWTEIATIYLSNSVSDEIGYVFLAEGLMEGPSSLEETEADLVVKKLPFEKVLQMVENGEITDSLSVIGILKLARLKGF